MAAAKYVAPSYSEPAVATPHQGLHHRAYRYTLSTTHLGTADNYIQFYALPKNCKLAPGWYVETYGDMDTHATPTLALGVKIANDTAVPPTADTTVFTGVTLGQGAAGVVGDQVGTGSALTTGWRGKVITDASSFVYLHIETAAATAASQDIRIGITYSMDTEPGEL